MENLSVSLCRMWVFIINVHRVQENVTVLSEDGTLVRRMAVKSSSSVQTGTGVCRTSQSFQNLFNMCVCPHIQNMNVSQSTAVNGSGT